MFIKSIRFKITVLYMAILAITLTSFSVVLYHNVRTGLYRNMDTLLISKAQGISKAIDAYWEASKFEVAEEAARPEILHKRRNVNFTKVAQRWVKEESSDPALLDIIVQVFDTDGAIIASSADTRGLKEISKKNFLPVLQGKVRFDTLASEDKPDGMTLRLYTTPVFENEKVAYIVQVASPVASIQAALNNLEVALFILLPITVFITGIMGAFLAKVTLGPVDNMIHTIHQITVENMKMKLAIPDTRDEIQDLAETFNIMLERLERAFTSQKQLFEDLSHELKTPLTILKGEFEVMLKKARSFEEYESVLKSALEEVNKMIKLAENLLLLAKLDSKEVSPVKKDLDLNLLIQGVVNNVKRLAESKGISLSSDLRGGISLKGDTGQLGTLFLNIIDNAVKHTPKGGRIIIAAEKADSKAVIKIRDTGTGIPEEDIDRVFDRFYRVDKSRGSSAGFGLGLSIAKSIVEAHSGSITAQSKPSMGTIFTITLPLH